ncbi:MAG: AI-2E family transporter [Clostridia bacterium]|nr:AI-2E family transporter [Clostridia bacterium]
MKAENKRLLRILGCVFALFLVIYYWDWASGILATLASAAMPLLIGCVIAYVLNIIVSFYERHYFPKSKAKAVIKSRRAVCMVLAIITLAAALCLVVGIVIPELASCVKLLVEKVPPMVQEFMASDIVQSHMPENIEEYLSSIDWKTALESAAKALASGISGTAGTVISIVSRVVSSIVSWVIGFVFALYLLADRERVQRQFKKLMTRYLPQKANDKIYYVLGVLNESFHKYIVGQCIEAVILGSLCAIGMMILRLPYAGMIGVLVGFTALIPVAGAYIGGAVGAVMMLSESPIKAVIFLVFLVVLQQLEGNLIYPRVVGSSIGLPGIWVLAAVTVGGSVSGILGMLVGVPLAAAVYKLLAKDTEKSVESGV